MDLDQTVNFLRLFEEEITREDVVSGVKLEKWPMLKNLMDVHCHLGHYMVQIKKCDSCWYCSINPPRLPENIFQSLKFVPYPEVENGSYKSFDDTYGKETSEQYRPSLASKPQKTERDKKFKSFFTAAKVSGYLICSECGKRRVVYSSATLLQRERIQLQHNEILEDNDEIDELKAQYGIVRPICESCFAKGLRPNVRNKIMVGQGKKSRKN